MCEKSGVLNSKSVPTYRTRTFAKKAYRTNVPYPYLNKKSVPYFFAKIEAYRTVPYGHPCPLRCVRSRILLGRDVEAVKFLKLPLPAPLEVLCFRVRFRFQSLSSKCFCFHKNLTAFTSLLSMKKLIVFSVKKHTGKFLLYSSLACHNKITNI